MPNGQFPEIISLSGLNGRNGFKIPGENSGDNSGSSLSLAGDINDDGFADLIIGAWGRNGSSGCSYVLFGGLGVGGGGIVSLSGFDGSQGFKLCGETVSDQSGTAVSGGVDINGDQIADLMIGAPGYNNYAGRSYAVFGRKAVGGGGLLPLSSLNGVQGFKLDGESMSDDSGYSISSIGDINGDQIADFVIGADGYSGNTGRSYVVFGGNEPGSGGVLALSSLNGKNGFKINGENDGDHSGWAVGGAGDINEDGVGDMLIGAYGHNNFVGRSYVVFGGKNVGGSGALLLSTLNGINGFKLDGEAKNDRSGWFVRGVGDVNGDHSADFIIGAWQHNNNTGRSYVVYGGAATGSDGVIALSVLNGQTGFKLDGETAGDQSGYAVSGAGDINGDGFADILIGAGGYNADKGRSYIVFGGQTFSGGILSLSSLDGRNGLKLDGESLNDYSGGAVSGVGDINGDGIDDLLIGAYRHNSNAGCSYVIFGDAPPQLTRNHLSLSPGETVVLTLEDLAATDRNHLNDSLVFIPGDVAYGHFAMLGFSNRSVPNFTQSQIADGMIQFTHDGSHHAPSYNMTVRSGGIAWMGPSPAEIDFHIPESISGGLIAGLTVIALFSTAVSGYCLYKNRKKCEKTVKAGGITEPLIIEDSLNIAYGNLKYNEKDKIGRGAYGTVYKSVYQFNQVAIKVLHAEYLSSTALQEFKREAAIMEQMRSDFIIQLRGVCFEPSHVCIVMELMPKGSLHQLLKNSPDLSLSILLRIGLDVIYGLYQLHEKNILHRDLKSLNILLDDRLRAKISDFGMSKIKSEIDGSVSTKEGKGTLGWMAPELFEEKPRATKAVDIYAYGMILWELMSKPYRVPFQNLAQASLMTAKLIRGDDQETIPKSCPPEMEKLIRTCWRKPEKRPSAQLLAKNLTTLFESADQKTLSRDPLQSDVPGYMGNLMSS